MALIGFATNEVYEIDEDPPSILSCLYAHVLCSQKAFLGHALRMLCSAMRFSIEYTSVGDAAPCPQDSNRSHNSTRRIAAGDSNIQKQSSEWLKMTSINSKSSWSDAAQAGIQDPTDPPSSTWRIRWGIHAAYRLTNSKCIKMPEFQALSQKLTWQVFVAVRQSSCRFQTSKARKHLRAVV